MAKIRVPKELRPPSRYGVYKHHFSDAMVKVSGEYRPPVFGEYFWNVKHQHVGQAMTDFIESRVIMERAS